MAPGYLGGHSEGREVVLGHEGTRQGRKQLVGMASQKMRAGGSKEVVVGRSRRFGRNG